MAAVLLVGCSPNPTTSAPRNTAATFAPSGTGLDGLRAIGAAYLSFQQAKNRPPKSYGELAAHGLDSSRPLPPGAGALTIAWGEGMGALCTGGVPGEVVIASAPATGEGIAVLFADGTVRVLTEAEFARANRPGQPGK